jgi:hypothetical protein
MHASSIRPTPRAEVDDGSNESAVKPGEKDEHTD